MLHNKANSIVILLKQLASAAPQSFTCNNMSGVQSDDVMITNDEEDDNESKSVHPDELVT